MLRIRLLGELCLELEGRRLDDIPSRRARSLLAWLAYHPGLHPRTRVAAVFWPNVLESSARASLRTTLATLRRELGEAAGGYVAAERERVGIVDRPELWVDVREIDRLVAAGRQADALALCGQDLLVDLDDDWVLEARQSHRERVGELLVVLGETAEAAGDLEAAVDHARRRLELDPTSEDAARVLMRRLAESGDRAAAVAAYEAFRGVLQRELGMAPSRETRALVEQLRIERGAPHVGVPTLPLPPALAHGAQTPFVGRGGALAALRDAWRRARAGRAAVVTVEGEAGSGKTRLLIELAEEVRSDEATVLAGRCTEDGPVAFAAFTEALRPYVVASGPALPHWVARELGRLLPELEPDAGAPEGEPQDARHRLFEAVAATIAHAGHQTPVLLILEDLHWADRATVEMLAHVIRTLTWAPVLVAGSLRDEGAGSDPALGALLDDLRRERRLGRVALAGLSEEETATLVGAWLGAPASLGLASALHRRTNGNPFFVEELARQLVESQSARSAEALIAAAGAEVPEGVRSLIDRRLARLPELAGRAVRLAAVAGEEFALADVAAACEERDDAVAEGLESAVASGLVDEGASPGRYRFAHALVREAVLAGLTGTRRALLHRRLGEVLEASPGDSRLPELARHLLDARPLVAAAKAAGSALRAAEQAKRTLAYEDAAELLARAADGELEDRDPLRTEVLLALADAYQRMGETPAARSCLEEAARLARALGSGELLARAALGAAGLTVTVGPVREPVRALLEEALGAVGDDSELRPRLLARLAIEVYYEPPTTLRERLSAEALDAGRRTGGRALLEALGARHVALWSPTHTEERLAIADDLVAAARGSGDREAELQGVNWRVADLFELGELDGVRAAIADYARLAADLRLPAYDWYVPMWRATLALLANRLEEAQRLSEEGARIGRSAHDDNAELLFEVQRNGIEGAAGRMSEEDYERIRRRADHSPAGGAWRAFLLARTLVRGDADGVARALEREVTAFTSAPLDANWLYTATGLGVLSAYLGDARAAAELYPRLLPYGHRVVTAGRACACGGSASLALGMLAATLGDLTAAVAHLEEAVRRNESLGAVAFAAASRHALAGAVSDRRRAAELREEAAAAGAAIGLVLPDGLLWRI
jgi:DNA-binding SARP family transcriptional activator